MDKHLQPFGCWVGVLVSFFAVLLLLPLLVGSVVCWDDGFSGVACEGISEWYGFSSR